MYGDHTTDPYSTNDHTKGAVQHLQGFGILPTSTRSSKYAYNSISFICNSIDMRVPRKMMVSKQTKVTELINFL